jgi:hypothetical protein
MGRRQQPQPVHELQVTAPALPHNPYHQLVLFWSLPPQQQSPLCPRRDFGLFVRRHHCRHCGLVFCSDCTCDRRPLPRFEYEAAPHQPPPLPFPLQRMSSPRRHQVHCTRPRVQGVQPEVPACGGAGARHQSGQRRAGAGAASPRVSLPLCLMAVRSATSVWDRTPTSSSDFSRQLPWLPPWAVQTSWGCCYRQLSPPPLCPPPPSHMRSGRCQRCYRRRSVRLHGLPALQLLRQRPARPRRCIREPLLQPLPRCHSHAEAGRVSLGLCRRHAAARGTHARGSRRRGPAGRWLLRRGACSCSLRPLYICNTLRPLDHYIFVTLCVLCVRSCCVTAPTPTRRRSAARRRCTSPSQAAGRTSARFSSRTAAIPTPPPPSTERRPFTGVTCAHSLSLRVTPPPRAVIDLQPRLVVMLLRCALHPTHRMQRLNTHLPAGTAVTKTL